jgi:protein-disulfide isomerase
VASASPRFLGVVSGIAESGPILGNPTAPVTATLYGDLECPLCRAFVLDGAFAQLLQRYVRPGKVRIVYRSLETATGNGPNSSWWVRQQVAALAAGRQHRFWEFAMLFLYDQPGAHSGSAAQANTGTNPLNAVLDASQPGENQAYVNERFIEKVGHQVPGLRFAQWQRDRGLRSLAQEVRTDGRTAAAIGVDATPTIVLNGPHGTSPPLIGPQTFAQLTRAVAKVS